ncbi:hypothetical protein J8273_3357 [Carpediemonas membranifera]|uniref:Uncharacterized protein n=1 Tax=Carpediemonas membranifera TaxID=201153 RepID=A0A8J6B551_9EUKA|nr:hypothetical protein J8273_3357 [Carpediemonas membranifera]|eukprot:KAG9393224.1 hypothetical protein J8273_3357 [Carpediemonas membranifera]
MTPSPRQTPSPLKRKAKAAPPPPPAKRDTSFSMHDTFNDVVLTYKRNTRHPELTARLKNITSDEFEELLPDGMVVVLSVIIDWLWDPFLVINALVYLCETMAKYPQVFETVTALDPDWGTQCHGQLKRLVSDVRFVDRLTEAGLTAEEVARVAVHIEQVMDAE